VLKDESLNSNKKIGYLESALKELRSQEEFKKTSVREYESKLKSEMADLELQLKNYEFEVHTLNSKLNDAD